jgi:hypothetical protein
VTTTFKRGLTALTTLAIMLCGTVVAASPAVSATAVPPVPVMRNIRTGLHEGFDRVVVDLDGERPGVTTRWTDGLTNDPRGDEVFLTGEFFLTVVMNPAQGHNDSGNPTWFFPEKFRTRDLHNVMAVAVIGDFEGHLSIGLGTRSQTWVRAFTLDSPTRVVIDIGN